METDVNTSKQSFTIVTTKHKGNYDRFWSYLLKISTLRIHTYTIVYDRFTLVYDCNCFVKELNLGIILYDCATN
ncbi:MAG: hypothetical protein ACK5QC_03125 [Bacteroidota bacterium]